MYQFIPKLIVGNPYLGIMSGLPVTQEECRRNLSLAVPFRSAPEDLSSYCIYPRKRASNRHHQPHKF
jgi:hypothetical protein